jgi:hypothetical protein
MEEAKSGTFTLSFPVILHLLQKYEDVGNFLLSLLPFLLFTMPLLNLGDPFPGKSKHVFL